MAPSSFASAAAGSNANSARTDSSSEWPRRVNGATQTFRRPSHATSFSSSSYPREQSGNQAPTNPGVYVPPHLHHTRNGASTSENRYNKEQLLDVFRAQKESDLIGHAISNLFVPGWQPSIANGASSTGWGRREDHDRQNQASADVCWDREGTVQPLGLQEMTDEERENFSSSVNSPLKPMTQNAVKEGTLKDGSSIRKPSISHQSHNSPGPFGLTSPTGGRSGGPRRRDTSDSYPFPNPIASPSTSRFSREESSTVTPPPSLIRRRTDFKEPPVSEERDKDKQREATLDTSNPFGSLKRTTTGPFHGGITSPTSPWSAGPQSAGLSTMGGAFGNFSIGPTNQSGQGLERRSGFGSIKGESRFKGLMAKDSFEDVGKSLKEKGSAGTLARGSESDSFRNGPAWPDERPKQSTGNETDSLQEDEPLTGSAALGGQDASPPPRQGTGFGTPSKPDTREETGFSAFGMTADNTGIRDIFHSRDNYQHFTPQTRSGVAHESLSSPTNTNPYQSPEHERTESEDVDTDGSDIHAAHIPGLGGFADTNTIHGIANFGNLGALGRVSTAHEAPASDRSQTSSAGPGRGIPNLGPNLGGLSGLPGLGGSTAWPSSQGAIGTPGKDKGGYGAFGDVFGSVGDLQSPSLAGLGPSNMYGGSGAGTIGRSSKMGSLFPTAMQEQMQQTRQGEEGIYESGERPVGGNAFPRSTFGTLGAGANPPAPARDIDSPFKAGRGGLEDIDVHRSVREGSFAENANLGAGGSTLQNTQQSNQGNIGQPRNTQAQTRPAQTQSTSSSASNQPPAAQQRTMVMPDRMRWIYQDPQGNTQGPWSGLEMHDWYKAGFFSPELLVKKAEDPDYEPLAQLIRRIGNSREPFLVPQIGIPHGPPNGQHGSQWPGTGGTAGAQPPFASSFPSFGTTLTAEQQNALERRKQEEQWLMARQKEHLAQQQVLSKAQLGLGQHSMLPQQLHHHSSAHSLHSQPSFGSITSPGGYQASPTQGPVPGPQGVPGFFDNAFRAPSQMPPIGPVGGGGMDMLGNIREEQLPGMLERFNLRGNQAPYGGAPAPLGTLQQPESNDHTQQVAAMFGDRSRLQREQAEHDAKHQHLSQHEQDLMAQASAERLQQFHDLQMQSEVEQPGSMAQPPEGIIGKPSSALESTSHEDQRAEEYHDQQTTSFSKGLEQTSKTEPLSLTEQVQKAASAKQTPIHQSPWNKIDTALPAPFPPPQSQSPLPAPAAQRKQNLADTLTAESRSQTATPSADTPSASIAPWAKEVVEVSKGPSLKEIQEAEAKKAAQAEEVAAAARRLALEKELQAHANAPQPAPGLPSTSNWASGSSPLTPNSATVPSAWAKPVANKTVAQTGPATKKTLHQIQKEEEARKQRVAAANIATAVSSSSSTVPLASGKRYADLASKQAAGQPLGGGAWTTVGASGKVKTPGSAPGAPAVASRSTSATIVPGAIPKTKPVTTNTTTSGARNGPTAAQQAGQATAMDELKKWSLAELKGDLTKGINAEDFVSTLLSYPVELDLVTEVVHSVSHTIDSRHFAEEFVRRRKLADKGIVDASSPAQEPKSGGAQGGGWSEVAKKGSTAPTKEEQSVNFKVVAAKKKGSKR